MGDPLSRMLAVLVAAVAGHLVAAVWMRWRDYRDAQRRYRDMVSRLGDSDPRAEARRFREEVGE